MEKLFKDVKQNLGKLIEKKRNETGLTYLYLETNGYISRKGLEKITKGISACTIDTLCMLIDLLKISSKELINAFF